MRKVARASVPLHWELLAELSSLELGSSPSRPGAPQRRAAPGSDPQQLPGALRSRYWRVALEQGHIHLASVFFCMNETHCQKPDRM